MANEALTKTSVVALTQLARISIFGDAVHVSDGCGTSCHLWWYGRHERLNASVIVVNPEMQRNIVNRNM
jgi:hypothetical protein